MIPIQTVSSGGPATNQVVTVNFDHTKGGTTPGIEDLFNFTNSPNLIMVSPPTLSSPAGVDIWSYSFTITVIDTQDATVTFYARLAAGSHLFGGASLNLSLPGPGQMQIAKPGAQPGSPDLAITKSGPSQAKTNQIITYVINYTNKISAASTAQGVQVSDIMPPQVTYVPGSASKGGRVVGNTITWDLGNLQAGKRGILTYKVQVTNNIPVTTTFANFAQIQSSQNDSTPGDNTASVTTTVVVNPVVIAIDDFYAIGKNTTLTVPAAGVLLNDSNVLSASLLSAPVNGALTFNSDGSFVYTPATNFLGSDIFAYVGINGTNNSGPAVVTIAVTNTCFLVAVTNVTTTNSPGQCGAVVTFPPPTTTGDCAPITCTPASGSFFPVGTNTVTCTNTDGLVASFYVAVLDVEAPVITCPTNMVLSADPGSCSRSNVTYSVGFSDNCPGATILQTAGLPSGSTFPAGPTLNSFVVTDASGNSNSCTFTVDIIDTQGPVITCPTNITVNTALGQCSSNVSFTVTAVDGCGFVTNLVSVPASGSIFPVGVTTVTNMATDNSGNISVCTFTITVHDSQPPTIACPADITVNANPGACFASSVSLGAPTASDTCGSVTVSNNAPATFPVGTNLVTWTAVDLSGNTATCQQRVIVKDNQGPVITCPTNITVNTAAGQCSSNVTFTVTAVDACGTVTNLVSVPASGSAFPVGVTTVTNTATDNSGNTSVCTFTVTVKDNQPPTITCPADITVNVNPGACFASGVSLGAPTASDTCGSVTVSNNAPAQFPLGTNLVTWTAVDPSGNTATCQQRVIVKDNQPPTITCPADIFVNAASGKCSSNVTFTVTAVDACGTVTNLVSMPASGFAFPVGVTTVTNTATDNSGNSSVCTFTVTVKDNQGPIIICPTNITINAAAGQCSSNVTFTVTAVDACGSVTNLVSVPASGSSFPAGVTFVTNTATDNSGNTSVCTFTVTVKDSQPPTISCPADITVNANPGACFASGVSLGAPTANDTCGSVTVSNNAPAQFPVGTNVVTWTAVNLSGNTATCQQLLIVKDNQGPVITCPTNIVVNTGAGKCTSNVTFTVTAVDACGTVTNLVSVPASGFAFPVGVTTVTNTATDNSGNVSVCTFTVTVKDNQPPTITCPADITVTVNPGACFASGVSLGAPTASDACGSVTVSNNAPAQFPVGTNLVTWTAVDLSGNSATCQQRVIVKDNQGPVITCPTNIIVNTAVGQCSSNVAFTVTAVDACGSVTNLVSVPASGFAFPVGTTTVTNTATDNSGNVSVCTFTVTVKDSQPPTITCPADVTVNANPGACFASGVNLGAPTASGTCSSVTVSNNAPAQFPVGTNVVTWTAVDLSGNTATCQQRVIVKDNQPPVITCPTNIIVNTAAGQCSSNVAFTVTAVDACGAVTNLVSAPASGSAFPVGTTTVTNTATDNSGNTSVCTFTVTVKDNQPPTITCPADITVNANPGACFASGVSLGAPTANDTCGSVTVSNNAPAQFPVGTNVVTWTAVALSGNTATCQQRVIVKDNQGPVITCPTNIIVNTAAGQCSSNVTFTVTAVDACGSVTNLVSVPASGSAFPVGTTTVTNTATDNSGNTSVCTFTVMVKDNQSPTITCPADVTVNANPGACFASGVSLGAPTANDTCGSVTVSNNAPAQFPVGTNLVTWTAVDLSGNTATCQQLVIVKDNQGPVITCPTNIIVNTAAGQCTSNVTFTVTAVDACGTVTNLVSVPASGSAFPAGTTTVTNTATDNSGNVSVCTFMVTVKDNQPPTISCPADVTVNANPGACFASGVVLGAPTASDSCGSVTVSNNAPAQFPVGTNLVTWTTVDLSGNTAACQQRVIVKDNQGPAITCPTNIIVNTAAGLCSSNVTFTFTAVDACGSVTNLASVPASGSAFPVGVTTVTNTATDNNGNTSVCTFTVTVRRTQLPTITCPGNIAVSIPPTQSKTNISFNVTASDLCGFITNLISQPSSGFSFPVGVTTVTNTATDDAGNASVCTFTVTVTTSNSPPVAVNDLLSIPKNTSLTFDPRANDSDPDGDPLTITLVSPTNGVATILGGTNVQFTPSSNYVGAATIGYTISDGSGTASALITINVTNRPPVAVDDIATTPENSPVTIQPLANDSDPDGDPLTIVSVTASNGTATIVNGTNVLFSPATNFNGSASVGYTISDGSGGNGSATITVSVTPVADIAVLKNGPASVNPGATFSYTITVTNLGPATATNVLVHDNLPTNVVFSSASSGGSISNRIVSWPVVGFLPSGTASNYTITVTAPQAGAFTNISSATSTTPDPNLANNDGTASASQVATLVVSTNVQFGILQGTNAYNPQTGLFEQNVTVTNTGASTVAAFRLLVGGLRTNVSLYNATGTNFDQRPYVQYNAPLNPGQFVSLVLEFYDGNRQPFTNSLQAIAVLPTGVTTNTSGGVAIDRAFLDTRIVGDTRFVIEFTSVPGRTYTVIYSDDGMATWKVATPTITAGSTRTQWYDDGPPETTSKPTSISNRFYRVIQSP
jgi:uncharacterized repeat protein (TIGR01451 family)